MFQVSKMWDCVPLDCLICKINILIPEHLRGFFQLESSLFLHIGLWLLKKLGNEKIISQTSCDVDSQHFRCLGLEIQLSKGQLLGIT